MAEVLLASMTDQKRTLYVWNRTEAKAKPLVDKGAVYLNKVEGATRCTRAVVASLKKHKSGKQGRYIGFVAFGDWSS